MSPVLPGPPSVDGVLRTVERTVGLARNGVRYLLGHEWAQRDPTPSDVVWQRGPALLRRYQRSSPAGFRQPVLAFSGLVGRPYCFDLTPTNSFVRRLLEAGFDAYVLDWGTPGVTESEFTLETYLSELLPSAIAAVLHESGSDDLSMLGYCMGGDMALVALAGNAGLPVRNLVVMTTAIDFAEMGPVTDALRAGQVDPVILIDESGNVPPKTIESAFKIRRPTSDVVQWVNLLQHLWDDEHMAAYQAMGWWVSEHVPMAGAAFRQVVDQWVLDNGLREDRLRLDGRRIRLGDIRVPTLAVVALRDDIVPPAAALPIKDALTGTKVELLPIDTGHTGTTTGRTAATVTMPKLVAWLGEHSEPVA